MEVTMRQEAGYDLALYGFSLSYKDRAVPPDEWWYFEDDESSIHGITYPLSDKELRAEYKDRVRRKERTSATATANAGRGKGHDKFLRQIMVWLDVEAPRYWWSEFDTYKVGTVAQSESTMHTLQKRYVTGEDFAYPDSDMVDSFNEYLKLAKDSAQYIPSIKARLPEGYLQRRLVTLNYAVLRTIIEQRRGHRLPEWATFIDAIYAQCEHPELLQSREV